jgi:hypothetical protein
LKHHQSIRLWAVLSLIALISLTACGSLPQPFATATSTPTSTATATLTALPTPTATPTTPVVLPTAAPTETPGPTPTPGIAWLTGEVRVFPGPEHYEGDILSFEIVVENTNFLGALEDAQLYIDGEPLPEKGAYISFSPLRDQSLIFIRVWDSTGHAGMHEVRAQIPASYGEVLEETFHIEVLPADQRPLNEVSSVWETATTDCCIIYYISGTAADRDIESIKQRAQTAADAAEAELGTEIDEPFPIVLLDNVWGNGAFAAGEIVLTYVDRSYVNVDLDSVIRHEATHYAARNIGTEAPTMLVEGIAVYVSGGHYKPEPIPLRAAALLPLNAYIPLRPLADDYRGAQHEIAYIEAAGLIDYLVRQYGWDKFLDVYGKQEIDAKTPAEWLDKAFIEVYGESLDDIEDAYLEWLRSQDPSSQVDDLRLTIDLFDTIRSYQALYAPYQEVLPSIEQSTERNITSEFVREPTASENQALEALLITAKEQIASGNFEEVEQIITLINSTLIDGDFTREPLNDYLNIVKAANDAGYEVQHIALDGDQAQVIAIRTWPTLETLTLRREGERWIMVVR